MTQVTDDVAIGYLHLLKDHGKLHLDAALKQFCERKNSFWITVLIDLYKIKPSLA